MNKVKYLLFAFCLLSMANATAQHCTQKNRGYPKLYIEYLDEDGLPIRSKDGSGFFKPADLRKVASAKLKTDDPTYKVLGFSSDFQPCHSAVCVELSNGNEFSNRQFNKVRHQNGFAHIYQIRIQDINSPGIERSYLFAIDFMSDLVNYTGSIDTTLHIEYINEDGILSKHQNGNLIAKADLKNAIGVKSEMNDVLSFNLKFIDALGNIEIEASDGNRFSSRQIERLGKMNRGRIVFISDIKMRDADNTEFLFPYYIKVVIR